MAATRDIREIVRYIAQNNSSAARKFEDEFWQAADRIATFPGTGHPVPRDSRKFLAMRVSQRFRRYMIVYHMRDDDTVEVVRVLHSARNISAML